MPESIQKREIAKQMAKIDGHAFIRFYDKATPWIDERVWIKAKCYCPTDGEYDGEEWYSPFTPINLYSCIEKHKLCVDSRKEITVVKFERESKMMTIKNKDQDVAILLAVIAKNA